MLIGIIADPADIDDDAGLKFASGVVCILCGDDNMSADKADIPAFLNISDFCSCDNAGGVGDVGCCIQTIYRRYPR